MDEYWNPSVSQIPAAVRLSSEQEQAIEMCTDLTLRIVSVTGGAGTGKTLVLGRAVKELRRSGADVSLCAPTGRAAKRIKELTGIEAQTIHKLLEFPQPGDPEEMLAQDEPENPNLPRRCKWNPIEARVVIVDETSMVGPTLYRQLVDALRPDGCIRFFGDNNQLMPVEEGDPPFPMLLQKHPKVTLNYNFRSRDDIVSNAVRVLNGRIPNRNERFEVIYSDTPLLTLVKFVSANPAFGNADHQIIMPTRKGQSGTARINPSIQVKLNKNGPLLRLPRFNDDEAPLVVRAKDKFLWVKNDYVLHLFNGEIGHVTHIDDDEGTVKIMTAEERHVIVPPRLRTYNSYLRTVINYDPRKQIELGYAITTHKSQGSEFNTIIYCIARGQAWLLNRNNFYTAITRAKHKVVVIADRRAMSLALRRETM